MIAWPSWLLLSSPVKLVLWIANRLATWTGVFYLWRRFRAKPHFWVWLVLLNACSFGGLCLVFFWLHARAAR